MTKKLTIIGLTVGQKFTLQLNTIINYIPKSMDEENIDTLFKLKASKLFTCWSAYYAKSSMLEKQNYI